MEHHSYLVRTWREGPGKDVRISIQNILTGERSNFYCLLDYFNFLCAELQLPNQLQERKLPGEGDAIIWLPENNEIH
jgi:hypothetical protein